MSFSVFYTLIRGNNYALEIRLYLKSWSITSSTPLFSSVPLSSKTYYCPLFLSLFHFTDTVLLTLFFLIPFTNCSLFLSWRESCCSQYASFRPVSLPPSSSLNPATNFSSNSWDFCIVSFQLQYWKVSWFLGAVIQSGISWFNKKG